ncbi:hypothetical protein NF865_01840 [Thermococcus aggregans]|uniref:Uncharacterized protein n=1 Tax=Thermococcus aggregans TaxID=110163 RepID=A0A9E7MYA0_THEAG|nr:hypothetical protein [Thermococcus aggregans]USS40986.1 hypothetical protein NF865_01840 [Thermococcus aggregans]
MKRRAFIFTLDALLALILVMVFISSLGVFTTDTNIHGTYFREQEKLTAEDLLTMYKTIPLKNLVPPEVLLNWTVEGIIDENFVSPEMPPLEIVATYWSLDAVFPKRGLKNKAEKILGYLLSITLNGYNYELLIENYTSPYLRNVSTSYSEARDVSAATLILSGYEFNQTPRGYVARAYITRLTSRRAIYMYFTGAANSTSSNITLEFLVPNEEENLLPPDASVAGVKWFFEPIDENSTINLFIDGVKVECGLNGPPYLLEDFDPNNTQECYMLEILREKEDLRQHEFKIVISNASNAGIRPNGYIVLYYDTAKLNVVEYPKTFYFDGIEANGSFEAVKGIFIPGNLTSVTVNVKLNPNPKNLELSIIVPNGSAYFVKGPYTLTYDSTTGSYWLTLNNDNGEFDALSRKYVWFKITVNASGSIKLEPESSFIKVEYTPDIPKTLYTMDILEEVNSTNLVSSSDYDFVWNVTMPSYATPLWARFNFVLDTSAKITKLAVSPGSSTNWTLVFNASSSTPLTSARWLLINNMKDSSNEAITALVPGENYVGMSLNESNEIQKSRVENYSIGELVYSIEVYVPYGEIKPFLLQGYPEVVAYNLTYKYEYDDKNRSIIVGDPQAITEGRYMNITVANLTPEEYAVDDAILSLFKKLGGDGWDDPIDVDIGGTKISFVSLEGIPKAIKPIRVTLRVWRED